MAITGSGRVCRTRHEPRVDDRVKRDRNAVANPPGGPAITTPPPDAGEKMGARSPRQPQTVPGLAAMQRRISSCWVLFARARENPPSQKTSSQRTGRTSARADLLLQHGLLRCAPRQSEIGPGPFAYQFQNGSVVSRDREERSRLESGPGTDLNRRDALRRVRRKVGRHLGRPSILHECN